MKDTVIHTFLFVAKCALSIVCVGTVDYTNIGYSHMIGGSEFYG